jgi:DNA polymerase III epsilon subunit-like protein
MNYVVVDLEWNQAMSSKSSVFNKLPIHLRGEIIEIGAVKLDDDIRPPDEFTIDVKPVYFKRMHYKVKKLTGFDTERLPGASPLRTPSSSSGNGAATT